jgi:hypothetical protein
MNLIERLNQIAEHDWRVSLLGHASDTAAEAVARITELEAERNRWSDTAGDWMERAVLAEAKLRTWETKVAAAPLWRGSDEMSWRSIAEQYYARITELETDRKLGFDASIADLQWEIGRLQSILHRRVLGDQTKSVGSAALPGDKPK